MKRLGLFALIALTFTACGNGMTGTDSGTPSDTGTASDVVTADSGGLTAQVACADSARIRCVKLDACTNGMGVTRRDGSMEVCTARESAACVAGLMSPMTANTPARVEACANAIMAQSCADARHSLPMECFAAAGPIANAMPCVASSQCASAYCAVPHTANCGVCAPAPVVGDSCANTGCGRDLTCNSAMQCAALVAANGACDGARPCLAGLTCVKAAAADPTGLCQPLVAVAGATCSNRDLVTANCDFNIGLYCNNVNQCATYTLATTGMACGSMSMGASLVACSGGANCPAAVGTNPRNCGGPAMDGAACDTSTGPFCQTPSRCVLTAAGGTAGTCRAFDPNACH